MSNKYTIGIDFGTLSGRALIVRTSDGKEICSAVRDYTHAVIDEYLPENGAKLPPDYALQDPSDYIEVLCDVIPRAIRESGISPSDVVGIGIDFTACTLLPVYSDGTPLCFDEKYKTRPHAYVKLWKHHAAQSYADRINAVAEQRGEKWLSRFGGKISGEWLFPKVYQVLCEDTEIYENAAYFIEAADWLSWILTGQQTRSYVFAGYKAIYDPQDGYPSEDYFASLDERLRNVTKKLNAPIIFTGETAGNVTKEAAERFGLPVGIPVSCPMPDAHVATPALGMTKSGDMFGIFGTSSCYMLLGEGDRYIPGICGSLKDGLIPGFYGYEAGLCAMGDCYAWLSENFTPAEYKTEADALGISPIKLLIKKAAALKPGESGIIALDWLNGNRNILVDSALSGLFVGINLQTKPEELMRALIEATAFGTKVIIDNFKEHGAEVNRFVAAGGIARKDPFTMQLFADVLGMEIRIAGSIQSSALAAAIFAAYTAGEYKSIADAAEAMHNVSDTVYTPNAKATAVYNKLYAEYVTLYDYFGRGKNDVMKRLREIKAAQS